MKTLKRVLSLILVASLMMFTVPVAFAANNTSAAAETEEEDILDNPIFAGAIKDIVVSFVESFTEIFQRYVEIIKAIIAEIDLSELLPPVTPEVPGTGEGETPSEGDTAEGDEGNENAGGSDENTGADTGSEAA